MLADGWSKRRGTVKAVNEDGTIKVFFPFKGFHLFKLSELKRAVSAADTSGAGPASSHSLPPKPVASDGKEKMPPSKK